MGSYLRTTRGALFETLWFFDEIAGSAGWLSSTLFALVNYAWARIVRFAHGDPAGRVYGGLEARDLPARGPGVLRSLLRALHLRRGLFAASACSAGCRGLHVRAYAPGLLVSLSGFWLAVMFAVRQAGRPPTGRPPPSLCCHGTTLSPVFGVGGRAHAVRACIGPPPGGFDREISPRGCFTAVFAGTATPGC